MNFAAFAVTTFWLGGDAFNGRRENGHYFLAMNDTEREVSKAVYDFSRWHATSVFVTFGLAMLAGLLLGRKEFEAALFRLKQRLTGRSD